MSEQFTQNPRRSLYIYRAHTAKSAVQCTWIGVGVNPPLEVIQHRRLQVISLSKYLYWKTVKKLMRTVSGLQSKPSWHMSISSDHIRGLFYSVHTSCCKFQKVKCFSRYVVVVFTKALQFRNTKLKFKSTIDSLGKCRANVWGTWEQFNSPLSPKSRPLLHYIRNRKRNENWH